MMTSGAAAASIATSPSTPTRAAIVPEIIVALLVFRAAGPVQKVLLLALRLLREQIIGEANGEETVVVELLNEV
jgi:hypothetical protein